MLIAKNFVWGLMDLAVILSCTREDASVCSWKPLEFLKMAANSQFLCHSWVRFYFCKGT